MTRIEEIKRRIEVLENVKFYIDMKDRWSDLDWKRLYEIQEEEKALKAELKELEN